MNVQNEQIKVYVAFDGEKFNSEIECKNYELTASNAIRSMFKKIPNREFYCSEANDSLPECSRYHICEIRDVNDVIIINMFLSRCCSSSKVVDIRDKNAVFYVTEDNDYYYEGTLENIVNKFAKVFYGKDSVQVSVQES